MPHTDVDYRRSHNRMVKNLMGAHPRDQAMSLAVGGNYEVVGAIEAELLKHYGLGTNDFLVDAGCGSGRLATALSLYLKGPYLGIDVVPELFEYAAKKANRRDWRFVAAPGLSIPLENNTADMVCFFSVFTHLFHQESYAYLMDAFRVLKPGGRVVLSFLEFKDPAIWPIFGSLVQRVLGGASADYEHVQFLSRDALTAWAEHLGFQVVEFVDGAAECVTLPHPVRRDDGSTVSGKAALGQAVCVLSKPPR
ncbi:MAG TPA: class I SAM-dependent methyltransferase [Bryobacteraceae bacterium]|nr:class I SAM-dependent methyltransferase [Bryobacteraceae bacterium]HUO30024.1 class I SAM-dependent methyltransferase [Bryobacteraceae bacterium]